MFRLARLELNKFFKKPLFYIMLLIVVLATYLSSYLYNPKITLTTPLNITYEDFISTKKNEYDLLDETEFENIKLFRLFDERKQNLDDKLNAVYASFANLETTMNKAVDENTKIAYNNVLNKLNDFYDYTQQKAIFNKYPVLYELINTEQYSKICFDLKFLISEINRIKSEGKDNVGDIAVSINELYKKNNFTNKLNDVKNKSIYFVQYIIEEMINESTNSLTIYQNSLLQSTAPTYQNNKQKIYDNMVSFYEINNLLNYHLKQLLNTEQFVFINKTTYLNYLNISANTLNKISELKLKNSNDITKGEHENIIKTSNSSNLKKQISNLSNELIYSTSDNIITEKLQTIIDKTNNNKKDILNNLNNLEGNNSKCESYINDYRLLSITSYKLFKMLITQNATKEIDNKISINFYGETFENFNKYNFDEKITAYEYYINNNIYEESFINQSGYSYQTTDSENGLNYVYFSIKLVSFIVILFVAIMAIISITNEQKHGTIKFILSRPYSRTNIVLGKLLSMFYFVSVLMLFNLLFSVLFANILYGLPAINAGNLLVVFNAKIAFSLNYILYILLYSLFQLLEVCFYAIVVCFFAFMFWSVLGTFITTMTSICAILSLNIFFKTQSWFKFSPFYNANLFKFFGSKVVISENSTAFLDKLLDTSIIINSNFWLSLAIISIYSALLILIDLIIYKKRDF